VTAAIVGLAAPAPAHAATCEPVRLEGDLAALPPAWRDALTALARATAQEGQPWSCPGGSAQLSAGPGGAILTVTDARGRTVSRPVPTPGELLATGEALLVVAPLPPPPVEPPPPAVPPAIVTPPLVTPPVAPPVTEPRRFVAGALLGGRASGPGKTAWASGQLRAIFPLGPWDLGVWARYDRAVAGPPSAPKGFDMDSAAAGLLFGRHFFGGPFELRATLDPSINVIMMEAVEDESKPHPEGAKVTFRIGGMISGSFPIAGIFRGLVAVDAEFAPAGVSGFAKLQDGLPSVPTFSAGLLLGVEAAIR
jgi:hypothetical protein